jgi:hypothetical protein
MIERAPKLSVARQWARYRIIAYGCCALSKKPEKRGNGSTVVSTAVFRRVRRRNTPPLKSDNPVITREPRRHTGETAVPAKNHVPAIRRI